MSRFGLNKRAALTASASFLMGFGALSLFSRFGSYPREVPGLYDYRAAVVGDALLIPLATYLLAEELMKRPLDARERIIGGTAGLIGLAGGGITVRSWLGESPSSDNWTQIHGSLNTAGWYHAVFLAVCSGLLLSSIATLGSRFLKSSHYQQEFLTSKRFGILLGVSLGFIILLYRDNATGAISRGNIVSLAGASLVFAAVLIWLAIFDKNNRKKSRREILVLAFGLATAAVVLGEIQIAILGARNGA